MTVDPLAEFVELSKPRRLKCGIKLALGKLAPAEQKALKAALDTASITSTAVEAWLGRRGIKVADKTISRHRQGKCACDG